MSSPIPIPSRASASSALYVPVHRRSPGSYTSSSSQAPSPSPSSSISISPYPSPIPTSRPLPSPIPGVYSPAELLLLSSSPLSKLSARHIDAHLRATAPEVMQTRKHRKAQVWRAHNQKHGRTPSSGSHTSESEEDRAMSWRRP